MLFEVFDESFAGMCFHVNTRAKCINLKHLSFDLCRWLVVSCRNLRCAISMLSLYFYMHLCRRAIIFWHKMCTLKKPVWLHYVETAMPQSVCKSNLGL